MRNQKHGTPEKTLEDLKQRQQHYTQCKGGLSELRECDEIYNKLNRRIIRAYADIHQQIFLGEINLYGQKRRDFEEGKTSAMRLYHGEDVCDFGCDFIVPAKDATLDDLLRQYNSTWNHAALKTNLLTKVIAHIYNIGGELLLWT